MEVHPVNTDTDGFICDLQPQEIEHPLIPIRGYCHEYTPAQTRQTLDNLIEICLIAEGTEFDDAEARQDLFVWRDMIIRALAANYLLTGGAVPETEKKE
jgi:hypothetical protein